MKHYNESIESIKPHLTQSDDAYNTRMHAFNIGLAYTVGATVLALCLGVGLELRLIWILRGLLAALVIGAIKFATALIAYTNEAREIVWGIHLQPNDDYEEPPLFDEEPEIGGSKTLLPNPHHENGKLSLSVMLTAAQLEKIATTILQHGKLTINYLIGLGIVRSDAERLREELVSHRLLFYNERGEALITNNGRLCFQQILT